MIDNDTIIFTPVYDHEITEDQFNHNQTAYEQQKKLLKNLACWTAKAATELEPYVFSVKEVIFENKISGYVEESGNDYLTIYNYPGTISKDATLEEKAACNVLKTANALYQSLFAGDKILIANLAIELGIAVAIAHASPFEKLASSGKKSKEGYKNREAQYRKENCQDWLKDNSDKISHITKKAQLKDIQQLNQYLKHIKLETLASWFSEIYPNQLKGGRPRKLPVTP